MENATKVYFDGSCPLCRREIGFYQGKSGADAIDWVDVSKADRELGPGLDCKAAMERFHVRGADGTLHSGAAGFAELWKAMPGFRWAGRFVSIPPVLWVTERFYRLFLNVRPAMQRFAGRLDRDGTDNLASIPNKPDAEKR